MAVYARVKKLTINDGERRTVSLLKIDRCGLLILKKPGNGLAPGPMLPPYNRGMGGMQAA